MPFAYYDKLPAAGKRTYRKSDRITRIELPDVAALIPAAAVLIDLLADRIVAVDWSSLRR